MRMRFFLNLLFLELSIPNFYSCTEELSSIKYFCVLKPSLLCCLDVLYPQDAIITNTLLFPLPCKVRHKASVVIFLSTSQSGMFFSLENDSRWSHSLFKKKKKSIFDSSLNFIVHSFEVIFSSTKRGSSSSVSRTKHSIWYMFHM